MKVKASVGVRCPGCYVAKRRNAAGDQKIYVYCKKNRRHNQRQG